MKKRRYAGIMKASLCMTCAFLLWGCAGKSEGGLQTQEESGYVLETERYSMEPSGSPSEHEMNLTDLSVSREPEDTEFYKLAADIPKSEVEQFAKQVKQQFLMQDWKALSEEFSYPITIDGTVYQNEEEFLAVEFGENLNPYFFVELKEESCENMFCNWSGIMLGKTGRVWIAEVLNDDYSSNGLKIRAVNGLTESFGLPGGVSMTADEGDITPASIKLKLENETDLNIIFGDDYELLKFEDGIWKDLLPEDTAFKSIAYTPKRGKPVVWEADWSGLCGSLEAGNYMIVKTVIDSDVKGDDGRYQRAFNFLIED